MIKRLSVEIILMPLGLAPRIIYEKLYSMKFREDNLNVIISSPLQ
jgi:hypothetical protein